MGATSADATSTCEVPTSNEWLRQDGGSAPAGRATAVRLTAEQVKPVTAQLDQAIAKLAGLSHVPLNNHELTVFTDGALVRQTRPNLKPYLVRAVFPIGNPSLDATWDGKKLAIFAFGLGCAPYVKHPIVVWLEGPPDEVFVMASAVL